MMSTTSIEFVKCLKHLYMKSGIIFRAISTLRHLQANSVVLDWDWPNVLVSNSKSINGTRKISIVFERGRLQQFIEIVR